MRATEKSRRPVDPATSTDLAILERRVRIARARYNTARGRADLAQRAHFWSDRPSGETREAYYNALREELDAQQGLEEAEQALSVAHRSSA